MKTYKNLYTTLISEENLKEAIHSAKKSKRIRKIIKRRKLTDEVLLEKAKYWVTNFKNAKHTPVEIEDGARRKKRTIIVPTMEELIVQHALVNVLKPMFMHGMYEHSYASIPNRGAHKGKKVIRKWLDKDPKNTKYVLKMDIRHFFDSIPHDILKAKISKYVADEKVKAMLFEIIDVTEHGIPLGFYTSQWLSNWYLQDLDHYIKEDLKVKHYIRYMDDMVLFGSNKKKLHRQKNEIERYLNENLGLALKDNWQVFPLDKRGLDFMGFRFFRHKTTLRRTIMLKATRKARKIANKPKTTIYDCRQMMSYLGWIKASDTYDMYLAYIKGRIDFGIMKRTISQEMKGAIA